MTVLTEDHHEREPDTISTCMHVKVNTSCNNDLVIELERSPVVLILGVIFFYKFRNKISLVW